MAYTKTNWVNDGVPAINASNLNKIEQGIYENSQNISELNNKATIARQDTNINNFKDWLINTAKIGVYLVDLNISGSRSCIIVQKASSSYLSFIQFGYGITAKQYKYNNGTWTEVLLG